MKIYKSWLQSQINVWCWKNFCLIIIVQFPSYCFVLEILLKCRHEASKTLEDSSFVIAKWGGGNETAIAMSSSDWCPPGKGCNVGRHHWKLFWVCNTWNDIRKLDMLCFIDAYPAIRLSKKLSKIFFKLFNTLPMCNKFTKYLTTSINIKISSKRNKIFSEPDFENLPLRNWTSNASHVMFTTYNERKVPPQKRMNFRQENVMKNILLQMGKCLFGSHACNSNANYPIALRKI